MSSGEIHRGYVELAKLAHPSHSRRLRMRDSKVDDAALLTIFEAAHRWRI